MHCEGPSFVTDLFSGGRFHSFHIMTVWSNAAVSMGGQLFVGDSVSLALSPEAELLDQIVIIFSSLRKLHVFLYGSYLNLLDASVPYSHYC